MNTNDIKTGMRILLNQSHPKAHLGDAGIVSQKKIINSKFMCEVKFDNGLKLFISPDLLEPEVNSKEEIFSIEKKTYSPAERAVYLAKQIIREKNLLGKINSLDQQEKDFKKRIEDIKLEKKKILDSSKKIEEAARRLTKIKALGDLAIITQINDSIPID